MGKETGATITVKDIEGGQLDISVEFEPYLDNDDPSAQPSTAQKAAMAMVDYLMKECDSE